MADRRTRGRPSAAFRRRFRITQLGALRYEFDTWIGDITVPANESFLIRTFLEAEDQVGFRLDGNPKTVATLRNGTLHKYQDQDVTEPPINRRDGGLDRNHGTRNGFDLGVDTQGVSIQGVEVK